MHMVTDSLLNMINLIIHSIHIIRSLYNESLCSELSIKTPAGQCLAIDDGMTLQD